MKLALTLALCSFASLAAQACTIFVLTDTNHALFCNNEDWSNAATRVWFVPAGAKRYGCAFVGFDDGNAQGGLNTEGLAFDWVAGYKETWNPQPQLPQTRDNQEVLETCATVEEAIAFYRGHQEDFSYCKILLADRSGDSVIIGAKDGKLLVEPSKECRGFGYGERALDKMLAKSRQPTLTNAACILRACLQKGPYATKYANVFDLKSGDIFLFPLPRQDDEGEWKGVKYNLFAELRKGAHSDDMPQVHLQPLVTHMGRYVWTEYHPIPDKEPKITAHVRAVVQDFIDGTPRIDDYTPEAWAVAYPKQKEMQSAMNQCGRFLSLTLVDRSGKGSERTYRYELDFERITSLVRFVFDKQNRLASVETEANHWKE